MVASMTQLKASGRRRGYLEGINLLFRLYFAGQTIRLWNCRARCSDGSNAFKTKLIASSKSTTLHRLTYWLNKINSWCIKEGVAIRRSQLEWAQKSNWSRLSINCSLCLHDLFKWTGRNMPCVIRFLLSWPYNWLIARWFGPVRVLEFLEVIQHEMTWFRDN